MYKMSGKTTIYTIAKEAQVSVSTVSRVFNNAKLVKPETARKVLAVAEKYSFTPSNVARAITTRKTRSIALIVPDLENPFFMELISGIDAVVEK